MKEIQNALRLLPDAVKLFAVERLMLITPPSYGRKLAKRYGLDSLEPCVNTASIENERKAIDSLLILVDSGVKLEFFSTFSTFLTDQGYWYGLGKAYVGSDWLGRYPADWKKSLFTASRPQRELLMNSSDLAKFNALPNSCTIYRSVSRREERSGEYGISWSLSRTVAEFFAFNYVRRTRSETMSVKEIAVQRKEIVAYFDTRAEREIIYIPSK